MKNQVFNFLIILLASIVFCSCEKEEMEACSSETEECTELTWYEDADGDGFGNPDSTILSCEQPEAYVTDNTDFDDENAAAFPGAEEDCNDGIDNNGNGEVDECSVISSIIGDWTTDFGDSYVITSETLTVNNTNIFDVLASGNDYVICQNDANNTFSPNLFSKFVFVNITQDEFNYCQSFFNSSSQMEIEDTLEPSDFDDLTGGCGGFAWGVMTRD